ncbi:MAG: peptide deformylase [Mycoplasma sp.]|nr:peptide deformylase [Mycoplasma sp.]
MDEIKNIVLDDKNPILRKHSLDLNVNNIQPNEKKLIDSMVKYIDISYNNEADKYSINPGIAIASNQVGLLKKVIYVHFKCNENEYKYLLANPKIVSHSFGICYLSDGEGCLSVKDKHYGIVPRYQKIVVDAYDLINKKQITINAENLLSICLQHEIDHLLGIIYYDHINKDNPNYVKSEWIKI